ncbi:MAG: amidohydrolase [Pseudomonadota bacterium]
MRPRFLAPLFGAALCLLNGGVSVAIAAEPVADTLLLNGRIYTVDGSQPWVEALAIDAGVIVFAGTTAQARRFQGEGTRVIDLDGAMALPGLHDSHLHPLEAFHGAWTCFLPGGHPPESYIPRLQDCATRQIGTDWVLGFGHSITNMLRAQAEGGRAPVEILDEAIPDRPAAMLEGTSHSVWANSLALAAAGFDAESADPPGGVILRDPQSGEPTGLLLDGAGEIVMDLAFAPSPAMQALNERAVRDSLVAMNRNGITSFADARAHWRRGYLEAYRTVADGGDLTARALLGLWAYPYLNDDEQIAALRSLYDASVHPRLRFTQIKAYADGEVSHTSAALLAPYRNYQLASPRGLNYFDRARLTRYITELEPIGFDFHIHTIGDRGVREALDAIASARQANGDLGRRHRLTHLEIVAPADIPRFVALDVVADVQMSSSFVLPPETRFYRPYLGARRAMERVLRLRDLWESGARVVLSSDYDVGALSPFVGMQNSLTRGDQSLPTLDAAIRAYTINAAYLMQQEDRLGSLEVGKLADLVVIDQQLFDIAPEQIGATRVTLTMVGGDVVFQR